MKRSLSIPATDKEVWDVIVRILMDTKSIKEQFNTKSLLGDGLDTKQIRNYIKNKQLRIKELEEKKYQLEKALIKVESSNARGEYTSREIYKGVYKELNQNYRQAKIEIESLISELEHLKDRNAWLEWIDEFGLHLSQNQDMSLRNKKNLLKLILKNIIVDHNPETNLHHLKINFKLPVLTDFNSILKNKMVNHQPDSISHKKIDTSETTIYQAHQPNHVGNYSTVTDLAKFRGWSTLQPLLMAM
jgi:predicted  nucleic acid-binding Zn-ribbon protein